VVDVGFPFHDSDKPTTGVLVTVEVGVKVAVVVKVEV
jgi:hypothetical protein